MSERLSIAQAQALTADNFADISSNFKESGVKIPVRLNVETAYQKAYERDVLSSYQKLDDLKNEATRLAPSFDQATSISLRDNLPSELQEFLVEYKEKIATLDSKFHSINQEIIDDIVKIDPNITDVPTEFRDNRKIKDDIFVQSSILFFDRAKELKAASGESKNPEELVQFLADVKAYMDVFLEINDMNVSRELYDITDWQFQIKNLDFRRRLNHNALLQSLNRLNNAAIQKGLSPFTYRNVQIMTPEDAQKQPGKDWLPDRVSVDRRSMAYYAHYLMRQADNRHYNVPFEASAE